MSCELWIEALECHSQVLLGEHWCVPSLLEVLASCDACLEAVGAWQHGEVQCSAVHGSGCCVARSRCHTAQRGCHMTQRGVTWHKEDVAWHKEDVTWHEEDVTWCEEVQRSMKKCGTVGGSVAWHKEVSSIRRISY
jgi:hypothetical protein